MTMPAELDGSLYFAEGEYEKVEPLFDEIKASGARLGLSSTSFVESAPFVRIGGLPIIGERAIREYFGLKEMDEPVSIQ